MGCLAKDPADRPKTTKALAELLGDVELTQEWTAADAAAEWQFLLISYRRREARVS